MRRAGGAWPRTPDIGRFADTACGPSSERPMVRCWGESASGTPRGIPASRSVGTSPATPGGQGYAAEAARAAIDWAWTVLEAPRLISLIHPENAASIRLADRLGERLLRHDTLDDEPVAIFGIARPSA